MKRVKTKRNTLYVGAHLGKDKTYLKTVQNIIKYGGNAVQIFTASPQSTAFPPIDDKDAENVNRWILENNIPLVSHAKYLINLSSLKPYPHYAYTQELLRIWKLGGYGSVVHLGTYKSVGSVKIALDNMETNIKKVIQKVYYNPKTSIIEQKNRQKNLKIILETSVGCGSQILCKISDLAEWYTSRFNEQERKLITFCIDTCHIFAAGYDIRTEDGALEFLNEWNDSIGLKKVSTFHLNDSKTPLGSNVDRHETLGKGYITDSKLGGSFDGIKEFIIIANRLGAPIITERGSGYNIASIKKEIEQVKKLIKN